MKVYLDITLLPGGEIGHHFLWEKVYQQVHLALVDNKGLDGRSEIGVSFPEFSATQPRLGRKLRIFAPDKPILSQLAIELWLERLMDYVHITSIRPVPESVNGYIRYKRLNPKSSGERLARRASKRKGISLEEAREERKNFSPQLTKAPYIWMKSLSSEQRFRLFIQEERLEQSSSGTAAFTPYGLAGQGALPWF
ncbi:MAG: type I-F CRISPR-associated endoribonuclease Cas6/Csy4 [Endozoicomonas sp.]|uniref:type I-F CRISPR-associated endoribonuclease Cas6/Csy4 n=1 Tax=Endozoicomonas sp. TaxID=1892382 RepID=UPI003D9BE694